MTTRRFTKSVVAATRASQPQRAEAYGRLRPGDVFQVTTRTGRWRFMALVTAAGQQHVEAFGPLIGKPGNNSRKPKAPGVRSFNPGDVKMPSQRMLNSQRRQRDAEETA